MLSVTVITLTYKNLNELPRTLASVFLQTFEGVANVQYIIADDCSENFNETEVYNFCEKAIHNTPENFELLVYSNSKNIGTVRSLNKALERATGDIIIPLSCGDEFFSYDSVAQIVRCFNVSSAPIITGFREIFDDNIVLGLAPKKYIARLFNPGNEKKLLMRLALKGNFISGASTYYSRAFLKSIGGFDERFKFLEDYPTYLKALNEGHHIDFFELVFMKHAVGGVSDPNSPAYKILKKDFELAVQWILENVTMNYYRKRTLKYFRLISKSEKLRLVNISKYPDCLLYWGLYGLIDTVRSFLSSR